METRQGESRRRLWDESNTMGAEYVDLLIL